MELNKIVLLPIPTDWRDSNSPIGDGLSLLNGFLQNLSLICAVTSTILKRTTCATYFGHFLLCEVKKIVLITYDTHLIPAHWNGYQNDFFHFTQQKMSKIRCVSSTFQYGWSNRWAIDFVTTHWATIGHHPWDCWSPSSPLGWVVKRFFSTPWQNKIEKRRKFKSYFTY